MLDQTHHAARKSWVATAQGHADFPIQNLPLGVFTPRDGEGGPRGGVAIGDQILDLKACLEADLLTGLARDAAEAAAGPTLNPLLALGDPARVALRRAVAEILDRDGPENARMRGLAKRLLHDQASCQMNLPVRIGDYTDFYAGIHHATNVGKLFRPDNPLLPNYKHVPIGYHGRASSVRASGAPLRRPSGQLKAPDQPEPRFAPSARLDYELELGLWVGPGNALGQPIPIGEADSHIVGLSLLNDWSARDVQAWEYQPLGPFLAKNFMTTVGPWIVTKEALEPFRRPQPPRPAGDPAPLTYLRDEADQAAGAFDIELEVTLSTPAMRENGMAPLRISRGRSEMYWTFAQLLTHHASGGCDLQPGDLLGSGTLSGADETGLGSLLELTRGGAQPIVLPNGESRTFLEDGDEIAFTGRCARPGFAAIGFGECRGRVGG